MFINYQVCEVVVDLFILAMAYVVDLEAKVINGAPFKILGVWPPGLHMGHSIIT